MSAQIPLFGSRPVEYTEPTKKWWTKKDQDEIIKYYALELGNSENSLERWNKLNYARNVRSAQKLLDYCTNIEQAKITIHNCNIERSKKGLEWSLAGDVLRNIHKFFPTKKEKGESIWH